MNRDKVYLKGYVIGRAVDTLGYEGLMVQLENLDVVEIDKNLVHRDINRPQKVTVPQFVADWIFKAQLVDRRSIRSALDTCTIRLYAKRSDEVIAWLKEINNQDIFVSGWVNGYHIEKEKRYLVKVKNIGDGWEYLKWNSVQQYWYFGNKKRLDDVRLYHTLENLQKGGFGNVFGNPLFTIEEVPE